MKKPSKKELALIAHATLNKTADIGLEHAKKNARYIKNTINDLRGIKPKPALVISAGPSLHVNKSLDIIKRYGFNGYVVAVDGTLGHCLRSGIIPDFVITVDPHPHRIVRWFGDTKLKSRPADDYFKRQDLDPALNRDQAAKNDELIKLVNKHGPKIKMIISTSVNPAITERCIEAGAELYWWNPLYDDYDSKDSISRKIYDINKVPCMVTGGNCGTSAWVFSHAILSSPHVIMVGMDLSYPTGTHVTKVQYYDILKEIFPESPEKGMINVYNPYLKKTFMTDPAYYWYSENFKDMAKLARCVTYNCTEGGILFGKGIEFTSLKEGLRKAKGS